jgi:hypothetical protein
MDRKAIAKRLQALAADDTHRSKAARFRDILEDVEMALAAGVARTRIRQELEDQGLEMTLATFDTTLARLRKKRQQPGRGSTRAAVPGQTPADNAASAGARTPPEAPSHSPAALNKIISSTPDLAALAKQAKKRNRK